MNTLIEARAQLRALKSNTIDDNLKRDLQCGWLLPYLIGVDEMGYRRWAHWCDIMESGAIGDVSIPRIDFGDDMNGVAAARKHIEKCLDLVADASWLGWSSWENLNYFLDWLLYGFGHASQSALPREPKQGISMRLYQYFNLAWPMLHPYDYLGDLMAECAIGRRAGFYPTPHSVTEMVTRMTFDGAGDCRLKLVSDPAMGTGRMLLHASNYSYRLFGQDILDVCVKATLVNGYLYAPWLVKPFPFAEVTPAEIMPAVEAVAAASTAIEAIQQPLFNLDALPAHRRLARAQEEALDDLPI